MQLITFHQRHVNVSYKNSLCSLASLFYGATFLATVLVPLYLVLLLSPRVWQESVLLWEQPVLQFQYQYNVWATRADEVLVSCSSLPSLVAQIEEAKDRNTTKGCASLKISEGDWNHDGVMDQMSFQVTTPGPVERFSVQLFFAARLHKLCSFQQIPSVLLYDSRNPVEENLVHLDLSVSQRVAFNCPLLFGHQETLFQPLNLSEYHSSLSLQQRLERGPGYFYFEPSRTFKNPSLPRNTIRLSLRIPQLMLRFQRPLWNQAMSTWTQFLAMYVVFYLMTKKLKDYVYGRYWIRSWEVIPWKKMY